MPPLQREEEQAAARSTALRSESPSGRAGRVTLALHK
jgi:hypothetical protein